MTALQELHREVRVAAQIIDALWREARRSASRAPKDHSLLKFISMLSERSRNVAQALQDNPGLRQVLSDAHESAVEFSGRHYHSYAAAVRDVGIQISECAERVVAENAKLDGCDRDRRTWGAIQHFFPKGPCTSILAVSIDKEFARAAKALGESMLATSFFISGVELDHFELAIVRDGVAASFRNRGTTANVQAWRLVMKLYEAGQRGASAEELMESLGIEKRAQLTGIKRVANAVMEPIRLEAEPDERNIWRLCEY